ncbi:MAG: hypothetical protein MI745_14185 [Pseudomonadales bacterium]|nr:hypothetical protein [Pseudomonadales bacterium]
MKYKIVSPHCGKKEAEALVEEANEFMRKQYEDDLDSVVNHFAHDMARQLKSKLSFPEFVAKRLTALLESYDDGEDLNVPEINGWFSVYNNLGRDLLFMADRIEGLINGLEVKGDAQDVKELYDLLDGFRERINCAEQFEPQQLTEGGAVRQEFLNGGANKYSAELYEVLQGMLRNWDLRHDDHFSGPSEKLKKMAEDILAKARGEHG